MYKHLETERLTIVPITRSDGSFMLELVNSSSWLQYIGDRNINDEQAANTYIDSIRSNTNYHYHVIRLKERKYPIGLVTFILRKEQRFPDIGYALLPKYEKQGYAFEAVNKYLHEILSEPQFDKVIAITLSNNHNSIRLLKRVGLSFEYNFEEDGKQLSLYSVKGSNNPVNPLL